MDRIVVDELSSGDTEYLDTEHTVGSASSIAPAYFCSLLWNLHSRRRKLPQAYWTLIMSYQASFMGESMLTCYLICSEQNASSPSPPNPSRWLHNYHKAQLNDLLASSGTIRCFTQDRAHFVWHNRLGSFHERTTFTTLQDK